ncbi:hypothetical protein ACFTAO_28495 [Paenibacillus rhizoplanae]
MLDPVLQAPDLKLAADSNQVLNYKRDANNYITQLFLESSFRRYVTGSSMPI